MLNKEEMLTVTKLSQYLDVSQKTIGNWYKFYNDDSIKKPENMPNLPKYIQEHKRSPRYWYKSDIEKLIEFKNWIPRGRCGVMGRISEKCWAKEFRKNKEVSE